MNVGDYVIAKKGYPEMGNANGRGYSICKITKMTPKGKFRIKELPFKKENEKYNNLDQTTSWDKYITHYTPDPKKMGILIGSDGKWNSGKYYRTYEKIDKDKLQGAFEEIYDGYN